MKLTYKGNKWDKEIIKYQEFRKEVPDLTQDEMFSINEFLNNGSNDYIRLYSLLALDYHDKATYGYLWGNADDMEIVKYTFLSGYARLLAKYIYIKGVYTKYKSVVENVINYIDIAIFELIAVDEIDNPYISIEDENLIMLMYHQKYEQAKRILDQIPDTLDESREVYYVARQYLKKIYMAIIERDEKRFNEELGKRIKKYRRNMVGYSTFIDFVSVALIKMAEKVGIHCTVDVIEIPKSFFDTTIKIDRNTDKLPYYDDFLKLELFKK